MKLRACSSRTHAHAHVHAHAHTHTHTDFINPPRQLSLVGPDPLKTGEGLVMLYRSGAQLQGF